MNLRHVVRVMSVNGKNLKLKTTKHLMPLQDNHI